MTPTCVAVILIIFPLTIGGFPPPVNITDIFNWTVTGNPFSQEECPFINSKKYLNDLAEHVSVTKPKFVKVIIGPKDAGKLTGILQLIPKWKQAGHVVIDLNLKGTSHSIEGKEAMHLISNQLMCGTID